MIVIKCGLIGVCEVLYDGEGHDVEGEVLAMADRLYLSLNLVVVCFGIRHKCVEGDDRISTCCFGQRSALLP